VAHACNPRYSGGLQFETSLGKYFTRPYLEKPIHKKRAGGVAQGEGPEFKSQYCKKKKKEKEKVTPVPFHFQFLYRCRDLLLVFPSVEMIFWYQTTSRVISLGHTGCPVQFPVTSGSRGK
jgi:hypothetical protein